MLSYWIDEQIGVPNVSENSWEHIMLSVLTFNQKSVRRRE